MANFTDNTTQLQNLLVKVNELPEAGGGGAVETCTVTFSVLSDVDDTVCSHKTANGYVYYSTFVNGSFKSDRIEMNAGETIVLENVIIGSEIITIWKAKIPAEYPDHENIPWVDNPGIALALDQPYCITAYIVKGSGACGVGDDY